MKTSKTLSRMWVPPLCSDSWSQFVDDKPRGAMSVMCFGTVKRRAEVPVFGVSMKIHAMYFLFFLLFGWRILFPKQ